MSARAALAAVLFAALATGAAAQISRAQRIFDVRPGMTVDALPVRDFVEPACGSNGGPRGTPLASFADFMKCRAEPGGLREVWFEYDDTAEYAALARRQPGQRLATSLLDQPVVLSVLIDEGARVVGYRIVTDARAEPSTRQHAHEIALHFKARFDLDASCVDLPAADGETDVEGEFVKEHCEIERNGLRIASDARFFRRAGQKPADPVSGLETPNAFESSARLEVVSTKPAEARAAIQPIARVPAAGGREGDFLAGLTKSCVGCALKEADLRYRDLTGADLSGADLEGALLHRANLAGANLSGATLRGANLNRANLTRARLPKASLFNAMLFAANLMRAEAAGADFQRAMAGRANLTGADLGGALMDDADFGEARLAEAKLAGARFPGAYFPRAILDRVDLSGAAGPGANFGEARLRGANLRSADLRGADFANADLAQTNLAKADLSGALLSAADLSSASLEGTALHGARMPDGSIPP